jgi:TetR/AcrR family transcriptional regulator
LFLGVLPLMAAKNDLWENRPLTRNRAEWLRMRDLAGQQTGKVASKQKTRIQISNEAKILDAALEVFSQDGFRGATLDRIAIQADMSKPNLLYYFSSKEEIHIALLRILLDVWLAPLRELRAEGDPRHELGGYIRRKLEMSRDLPRESRLFANEVMRGAQHIAPLLKEDLADLVGAKAAIIQGWIDAGKIAPCDPRHVIFAIWATTQHYADFDVQIRSVLHQKDDDQSHFLDAEKFLTTLFLGQLIRN